MSSSGVGQKNGVTKSVPDTLPSLLSPTLISECAAVELSDVPEDTLRHVVLTVADTLGVIMGGGQREEAIELAGSNRGTPDGTSRFFGPAEGGANLLVPGFPRADTATAAFVNATCGTFLELDEGYRPTGHPAVHVVPAALATAQTVGASGAEFLSAVIGGYELTARLFEAFQLRYPVHPHGHFGAVGAAVATASILRKDPVEAALIASSLPLLPVWHTCYEGATVRNAYSGFASLVGITANRLAGAGFTGSRQSISVTFGEIAGNLVAPEALTRSIEYSDLSITRNYLKLHSACALSHSALDAILALDPPEPGKVSRVVVETISNNLKISRKARPNNLSARFSLPYAVAAAIVHGHTGPLALDYDAEVDALSDRVEVLAAPELERCWPRSAPARVTIYSDGGHESSARVDNPRGHHANPALPEELAEKFVALARVEKGRRLYDRLLSMETIGDVAELLDT